MKNKIVEKLDNEISWEKLFTIKHLSSEFPKLNFKISKINSTIICALKALKSIFYTQFVEYFTTMAHC